MSNPYDLPGSRLFSHLVANSVSADKELARLVPFVFEVVPGALEVARGLAAYLVDLPTPCRQKTLFGQALCTATYELDKLGIVPCTIACHYGGYAVFVASLLQDVEDLARVRVSFDDGSTWRPQDGPFLRRHRGKGRVVSFTDVELAPSQQVLLRVSLLTHMISSTDLPRLGSKWRDILQPELHHAL